MYLEESGKSAASAAESRAIAKAADERRRKKEMKNHVYRWHIHAKEAGENSIFSGDAGRTLSQTSSSRLA